VISKPNHEKRGALKILSWQNIKGVEKEKRAKARSVPFYDCITSHTAMTGNDTIA